MVVLDAHHVGVWRGVGLERPRLVVRVLWGLSLHDLLGLLLACASSVPYNRECDLCLCCWWLALRRRFGIAPLSGSLCHDGLTTRLFSFGVVGGLGSVPILL